MTGPTTIRAHAMRPARAWIRTGRERGSAVVEAAVLIVVLVVPMFYLVATLGRLQAGALAAASAAREAGRAYATADDAAVAPARAQAASALVFESFGFTDDAGVALTCIGPCLSPGSSLDAVATVEVTLPLIPDFALDVVPARITLTAEHSEAIDEYRGLP